MSNLKVFDGAGICKVFSGTAGDAGSKVGTVGAGNAGAAAGEFGFVAGRFGSGADGPNGKSVPFGIDGTVAADFGKLAALVRGAGAASGLFNLNGPSSVGPDTEGTVGVCGPFGASPVVTFGTLSGVGFTAGSSAGTGGFTSTGAAGSVGIIGAGRFSVTGITSG